MKKKDLEYFKKLLQEEINKVLKDMGYIKETLLEETSREAAGDHSGYSFHMADQGSDTHDREKQFMLAARENKYLSDLADAMERVKAGTYGVCMICNKDIEKERLEMVLVAKYHVACKKKLEEVKQKEHQTES
ncbi:MAG TPA: TraR/DksA family transcriptional regulator [bacterium]|nr:TraR/DksA family transcriptional regulator [bacterium]HMW36383.1 TraR/DksA family transcriptional regulator [bacterium]HMY37386.1 TraR/DksA family transcriptional regulator [bacterium]HMZ05559.1 TraR/DksA family transcriptional regulator [bacterium]HNB09720.1 TraR/DksA family transcriptional regulator [bacterium]